jgi:two-component system response regulator GlrR
LLLEQIERLRNDVAETLARAIAERRFHRVGDEGSLALTARVIVAAEARPSGTFLGGIPHHAIELAPLAERREDILPLAAHFLASSAEEIGVAPVGFTADARAFLLAEPWPGNVRELRQRIRQAVRLSSGGAVSAEALLLAGDGDEIPSFKEAKRAFETRYVVNLLRRCSGNISRAARLAKKDRKDFYDVIRRTGIDPTQFR